MSTRAMHLRENVPLQVFGSQGSIFFKITPKGNGIAVNHRPDMLTLVYPLQGKHPAGTAYRIGG